MPTAAPERERQGEPGSVRQRRQGRSTLPASLGEISYGAVKKITEYSGWKPAKAIDYKELGEFLPARAMGHDSPSLLFRLGCEPCDRRR
ncbi:hypothetical protein ACFWAT_00295 [Streptomyces syringium]|uniref:hypothetical protein n=1 Tax=Streptomyces syringium TaxID=76729 RepID=UPI0036552D1A